MQATMDELQLELLDDARVSVPQAAKLLGVSVTTMHELLDRGRIPYETPSKHRRVMVAEVLKYRNAHTHRPRRNKQKFEDLLAD